MANRATFRLGQVTDRFWPILLKKSVLARVTCPLGQKRLICALLREIQGSSAPEMAQISA
jgi:hypothetical protein